MAKIKKKSKKNKNLTPRQELFCQYYATYKNPKKAAIEAGYSERSADSQASELLKNPKITSRIKTLTVKEFKKLTFDKDEIFTELVGIATSNIVNYVDDEKLKGLSEKEQKAVKKFIVKEDFYEDKLVRRVTTIELHDKLKAIESLKDMQSLSNPAQQALNKERFEFEKKLKREELALRWQEVEKDKKEEITPEEQAKINEFK